MVLKRTLGAILVLCFARLASAQAAPVTVSGVVQDQTGGVLPHARVELANSAGVVVQSTATDELGAFRFDAVAQGSYELRAAFQGFRPGLVRLRVGPRPPAAQKLVLALADVEQSVSVDSGAGSVDTSASNNLSAVAVDRQMLEGLPVWTRTSSRHVALPRCRFARHRRRDDRRQRHGSQRLANVRRRRFSRSRSTRIPMPRSTGAPAAAASRSLTKPGGQQYHGEVNTVVRDAHLDARNAFAATKPDEQKRIFEGVFGGPIGSSARRRFCCRPTTRRTTSRPSCTPSGRPARFATSCRSPSPRRCSPARSRIRSATGRSSRSRRTIEYEATDNRGVGGVTLASAGSNFTAPRAAGHLHAADDAASDAREPVSDSGRTRARAHHQPLGGPRHRGRRCVHRRRRAGRPGAHRDAHAAHEREPDLDVRGHNSIQAGFQLPDWSRRGFFDRTNFGGTYFFSGLDAYAAGQPYAFTAQRGNGDLALLEKQVGAYVKDDWQARPDLTLSLGVRYDWQNYFHDDNNVAPRASFAYAPGRLEERWSFAAVPACSPIGAAR